jgi:hypothetical protein
VTVFGAWLVIGSALSFDFNNKGDFMFKVLIGSALLFSFSPAFAFPAIDADCRACVGYIGSPQCVDLKFDGTNTHDGEVANNKIQVTFDDTTDDFYLKISRLISTPGGETFYQYVTSEGTVVPTNQKLFGITTHLDGKIHPMYDELSVRCLKK